MSEHITFRFASLGDLAEHIATKAAEQRKLQRHRGLSKTNQNSAMNQAYAYDQAAFIIRNSQIISEETE